MRVRSLLSQHPSEIHAGRVQGRPNADGERCDKNHRRDRAERHRIQRSNAEQKRTNQVCSKPGEQKAGREAEPYEPPG